LSLDGQTMTTPANGHSELATLPGIELHIKFVPSTGQFLVQFPQVDHVTIMGLLEFAKLNLMELRAKADKRIAIPDAVLTNKIVS
jgi:hypothetical protein